MKVKGIEITQDMDESLIHFMKNYPQPFRASELAVAVEVWGSGRMRAGDGEGQRIIDLAPQIADRILKREAGSGNIKLHDRRWKWVGNGETRA